MFAKPWRDGFTRDKKTPLARICRVGRDHPTLRSMARRQSQEQEPAFHLTDMTCYSQLWNNWDLRSSHPIEISFSFDANHEVTKRKKFHSVTPLKIILGSSWSPVCWRSHTRWHSYRLRHQKHPKEKRIILIDREWNIYEEDHNVTFINKSGGEDQLRSTD